jgi:hypothetical protein
VNRRWRFVSIIAFVGIVAACAPSASPPTAAPAPTSATSPAPASTPAATGLAPSAIPITGFAFDAESVAGYYATLGYACADPQPSSIAADYQVRTCQLVDPAGRTLVVGLVTDANGDIGDAFASVHGAAGEAVLEPEVALQPFAAFMGAMLGGPRGESLLAWLAGHLGDDYAETTIDVLRVATYVKDGDHSTLYLELADAAYLAAPSPSGGPVPTAS